MIWNPRRAVFKARLPEIVERSKKGESRRSIHQSMSDELNCNYQTFCKYFNAYIGYKNAGREIRTRRREVQPEVRKEDARRKPESGIPEGEDDRALRKYYS